MAAGFSKNIVFDVILVSGHLPGDPCGPEGGPGRPRHQFLSIFGRFLGPIGTPVGRLWAYFSALFRFFRVFVGNSFPDRRFSPFLAGSMTPRTLKI